MAKVQILDRSTPLTEKGDRPSLQLQVLWSGLRRDVDIATAAASANRVSTRAITASGSALAGDFLILADATAGAVTVTLPPVASSLGALIVVKKTDASANAVTVDGSGAETIDGATTQALAAQYDAVTVVCDGIAWWIA